MKKQIILCLTAIFIIGILSGCKSDTALRVKTTLACGGSNVSEMSKPTDFMNAVENSVTNENFTCAEAVCDQFNARHPEHGFTFECRGRILFAQQRYAEALPFYNKTLEKKPNYAPGYMMRAKIYSFEGNHAAAIADTDSALKIFEPRIENPEDREYAAQILGWRGYYRLKKGGEIESALSDLNRAVELDPNNYLLFYTRAEAYRQLGQKALADADSQRGNELKARG